MSAHLAPAARPAGLRRVALAFPAAVLAAVGAALLLPPPSAPPLARFAVPQGEAGQAAELAALRRQVARLRAGQSERLRAGQPELLRAGEPERLRAGQPERPTGDQHASQRGDPRAQRLATALERLHALTGEPAPLREAMDLRRALGEEPAARAALRRLVRLGAATEAEALALAAELAGLGDAAGAADVLLRAPGQGATPELALRTAQAAAALPDPGVVMRPLGARLAAEAPELLEALRRVLLGDGRAELALLLLEGQPAEAQATPQAAFLLAQAEARAGWTGGALARLLALRATEGLPAGAGALLVDLALREGRLEEAFEVAGQLPPEAWPAALPLRLAVAARVARRPDLPWRLDLPRLLPWPEAAAALALAGGDPALAQHLAEQALARPPATAEGARALALVLRERGREQAAEERLRRLLAGPPPEPAAAPLLAELAGPSGRAATVLPLLRGLRDHSPPAAEAWLRLALVEDRLTEAAAFLQAGGPVSAPALAETVTQAARRRDATLAEAAAAALRDRAELPEGWTAAELAATAALARPATPASLSGALDLLGWITEAAARDRVVALLAAMPETGALAAATGAARHPAIARLRREASAPGEAGAARRALLAALAPREPATPAAERAALRARAAQPGIGAAERRDIARRLRELGDREGEALVLQGRGERP